MRHLRGQGQIGICQQAAHAHTQVIQEAYLPELKTSLGSVVTSLLKWDLWVKTGDGSGE